jgi:hypothetical protein
MAYRQQQFISLSSEGWEFQDLGVSRFDVWWGPISQFKDDHILTESSHGEKGKGALWELSGGLP